MLTFINSPEDDDPPNQPNRFDEFRAQVEKATQGAVKAINELASTAAWLELETEESQLRSDAQALLSDEYRLLLVGRFNGGKSTLLNGLLGGTTHKVPGLDDSLGPLPVDEYPATAVLTWIKYADQPSVAVRMHDGTMEEWSLDRFRRDSSVLDDPQDHADFFQEIKEFELGFPARLCKAGIVIGDTPGLEDASERTAITLAATEQCDAVIILYDTKALRGDNEAVDVRTLIGEGTRVFTVVNLVNGKQPDDKLKSYVWNRIIQRLMPEDERERWAGQNLRSHNVYFVDALAGARGRYTGDAGLLQESGLLEFEDRLRIFLAEERLPHHLSRFAKRSLIRGRLVLSTLDQRIGAAEADKQQVQSAFQQAQPKLAELRSRPKRLPGLLTGYQTNIEAQVTVSFDEMIAQLRADLPEHLASVELVKVNPAIQVFQQKKLAKELSERVNAFVEKRLAEWEKTTVPEVTAPIIRDLRDRIEREITNIAQGIDEVRLRMTGLTVEPTARPMVRRAERILFGLAHLAVLDPAGALTAAAGGWRGAAGAAGGLVIGAAILGAVGVSAGAPIVVPALLLASFLGGVGGGTVGLKKRAVQQAVQMADGLISTLPQKARPLLKEQIAASFSQVEKTLTAEIQKLVDQEIRQLTLEADLQKTSEKKRADMLAKLKTTRETTLECLDALEEALAVSELG